MGMTALDFAMNRFVTCANVWEEGVELLERYGQAVPGYEDSLCSHPPIQRKYFKQETRLTLCYSHLELYYHQPEFLTLDSSVGQPTKR
jgi:hypothetical protein